MNFNAYDHCCAGKMRECKHDFMARVGDEIIAIKDVPAFICGTCGEVEYTLGVSREIDAIMKEFFAGRLLARPLAAGRLYLGCGRRDPRDEHLIQIDSCQNRNLKSKIGWPQAPGLLRS